jgi:CelD/BcsL family acetyltransferase involved in cellulose biosynthesis
MDGGSPSTVTPPVEVDVVLERVALADIPEGEWDDLAHASGNIFATRAWLSTWSRHFGAGRELVCYRVRRGDSRLAALLLLCAWCSRLLRVLRFLGHPMGGRLGPICAPSDRPLAAMALAEALSASRFDVFVGEGLEGTAGWPALLGQRPWRRTPSPRLALRFRSWQEFLASRSANFRQELRRKERRLTEQHDVRFRLAVDEDRLHRDLDTLFDLHRARWAEPTAFSAAEAFHRAFAAECFRRGWLRPLVSRARRKTGG